MVGRTQGERGRSKEQANKDLVRRYHDALDRGASDEAAQMWAPDAVNHASGRYGSQQPRGRDAVRRVFRPRLIWCLSTGCDGVDHGSDLGTLPPVPETESAERCAPIRA